MEQQARIGGFFEGGLEGLHQCRRQIRDKPHGIGKQHRPQMFYVDPGKGGIECGEQLIGRIHLGGGDAIE